MNQIPYGFRSAKALGMVPIASDHIAELALIDASREQRQRWNDALLIAGLSPAEADAICPTGATIINLEARKAK